MFRSYTLEFSVCFGLRHIQERNGFKEMLQQPCRVNVPANITFAGGDVVKERFYVLLPWIKVGSSANCLNWHVLKPETTKRNHRNETTETSETSETKPPKPPKRPKRLFVSVVSFRSFRWFRWFRFGRFARFGGFVSVVSFRCFGF